MDYHLRFQGLQKRCRRKILLGAALIALLALGAAALACTAPEATPTPPATVVPTAALATGAPLPTAAASPTSTPPSPTAAPVTQTPVFSPVPPTGTPAPTDTPAPISTATPVPLTATATLMPEPTEAPPTPTSAPLPTFTTEPIATPAQPNPLAGLAYADWLEQNQRARANRIKQLTWVSDGVDDAEREAAELLIASATWHPGTFGALLELPWIADSITLAETHAIYGLRWAARYNLESAELMLQKPWVQDGITRDEATVIRYVYWMSWYADEPNQEVSEAVVQILNMPFLESVSGADAMAVHSLQRLVAIGPDVLLKIMSHPSFKDGITDEKAKTVALLGGTYKYRPESADVLLRGTGVYLEERTIELTHSGEVLLAIIRIRDQVTPSMDYLEHSVRTIEEFMGEPLPTNYIALFFDDANVKEGGGQGTSYGTHIAMSLDFDVENGWQWQRTPAVIAHEVAHQYWRGNSRDWVDEGPANFLEYISENARIDAPIKAKTNPCASAKTIAELDKLAVHQETWQETVTQNWFRCNYSLGERLFVDLYDTLGEEAFRQGFRNLYWKSLQDDTSDSCGGTDLSICHVIDAFKAGASDDVAAKADEVIARWYGPLPGS